MPDDALKPALSAALRLHEIGDASPYQLSFAGKGKSGASFGFMQGDLAASQTVAQQTFRDVLAGAGFADDAIASLLARLSVPLLANPLGVAETARVNAALLAGKDRVDAMDQSILGTVYRQLDTCMATAAAAGRTIDAKAQIYIALWVNMTGPPSTLLVWLGGAHPNLRGDVPPAGAVVDGSAMETYLRATDYFIENPGNLPHMMQCAAAGAAQLRGSGGQQLAPQIVADAAADDHFLYEQASGRMFLMEGGTRDFFAAGYSGSDQDGGKNNPQKQCEADIGPLPRGTYTIGPPFAGPSPLSLRLTPAPENEMCGRSGFLIHGDSIAAPGTASHGCIILAKSDRQAIVDSGVSRLLVVDRAA